MTSFNTERLFTALNEEDGLSTFVVTNFLAMGILALVLIFTPQIKEYLIYQFNQTGADSSALAYAEGWADELSITLGGLPEISQTGAAPELVDGILSLVPFVSGCYDSLDETQHNAAMLHATYFYTVHFVPIEYFRNGGDPRALAKRFAGRNNVDVDRAESYIEFLPLKRIQFQKIHHDVLFPPIVSEVDVSRPLVAQSGEQLKVPAYATGITYLSKVELDFALFIPNPFCTKWLIWQKYTWRTNLVTDE